MPSTPPLTAATPPLLYSNWIPRISARAEIPRPGMVVVVLIMMLVVLLLLLQLVFLVLPLAL